MEEEARHSVHFPPSSSYLGQRREKLQKIHDFSAPGADSAFGVESVKRGEVFTYRQTRNWLKKQTSSATVFTQAGGKLQGVAVPAYAHINKSTGGSAKANSNLGGSTGHCQSQLSIEEDLDEDMTRILNQLKANIRLEA